MEKKFCKGCGNYPHDGACKPAEYKEHQKWVNEYLIPHNKILDECHTVPHVEMEVTVKFKMLVKANEPGDVDGKLRANDQARSLHSDKRPISQVKVVDVKLGDLDEVDKMAFPFYLRMEGWSIKNLRLWRIRYERNSDNVCLCVDDEDITKLLGIRVLPLTKDTAVIKCMCLESQLEIFTTLDKCPEDVNNAMLNHECQPWPG
jgi:hypothetical protein